MGYLQIIIGPFEIENTRSHDFHKTSKDQRWSDITKRRTLAMHKIHPGLILSIWYGPPSPAWNDTWSQSQEKALSMTGSGSKPTKQKTTINKNTKILKEPWLGQSDVWHLWNNFYHRVNKTILQQVASNYWVGGDWRHIKKDKGGWEKKKRMKKSSSLKINLKVDFVKSMSFQRPDR